MTVPLPAPNKDGQKAVQAVTLVDQLGNPVSLQVTVQGGGGGTASTYTHTQVAPSAVWTIDHMLGRFPSVTMVNLAGQKGEGDVDYLINDPVRATNTLLLTFSEPISGKAFLN